MPGAVLNKPGRLTEDEMAAVCLHPVLGETILEPLLEPPLLAVVRHHHEQWNGTGYPDGLAGEAIPLGARIVAVADSYDAMTSARPYRSGMPSARALAILEDGAGIQWDADVIAALLALARENRLETHVEEEAVASNESVRLELIRVA